jgi:transcriptional regulator with XRE-family HTH domain
VPKANLKKVQIEIGRRVRAARTAVKMTQEDAAAAAGIDYKRLQRIEQGTVNVTVKTLVRIAAAFETDIWSLLACR